MPEKIDWLDISHRIRSLIVSPSVDGRVDAAELLVRECSHVRKTIKIDVKNCDDILWQFTRKLIRSGKYGCASHILWGDRFDMRPQSVQRIIKALKQYPKVAIPGASGQGKTFTAVGIFTLDWLGDPFYLNCGMISVTGGAADTNIKSQLTDLREHSALPFPGVQTGEYIGLDPQLKKFGIKRIAIRQGDNPSGVVQGQFHPFPRAETDPDYGTHSRGRLLIDEAERVAANIWLETPNVMSASMSTDSMKIVACWNCHDQTSRIAMETEPPNGWDSLHSSDLQEWDSRMGWHVVRLDAEKSENIQQKTVVYPGMQTEAGYKALYGPNGEPTQASDTFGRARYPKAGSADVMVRPDVFDKAIGTPRWANKTTMVASLDAAFQGSDRPRVTLARWGESVGYTDNMGEFHPFEKVRDVGQVEQQFNLENGDTRSISSQTIGHLKALGISSYWFVTDMTGTGEGCHSIVNTEYHAEGPILGIMYGARPTVMKIMGEDKSTAEETCNDLITEMYYATSMWLEHHYLFIAPGCASAELKRELCTRRYDISGKPPRRRCESKKEYKARGNSSPDCSDSMVQIVQLFRTRGPFKPEMVPGSTENPQTMEVETSVVDVIPFMSMRD